MKATTLSPVQLQAIAMAQRHNVLVRWAGGFWTYPGCEVSHMKPYYPYGRLTAVPTEWVQCQTVYALEGKGVLRQAGRAAGGFICDRYELMEDYR